MHPWVNKVIENVLRWRPDFFLKDKQLTWEMKKPFASLRARAGARAMYPNAGENSQSVRCYNEVRTYFQQNY
jgi:hypothetical protein